LGGQKLALLIWSVNTLVFIDFVKKITKNTFFQFTKIPIRFLFLMTPNRSLMRKFIYLYIFILDFFKIINFSKFSNWGVFSGIFFTIPGGAENLVEKGYSYLDVFQTINEYFFSPQLVSSFSKNSRWFSMEEIINHFLFYSEGPVLVQGFAQGTVEAPKGHLGVIVVSDGTNKLSRSRVRSSILVMAGHINTLVQGVGLGDFVVIVSASNIVVGEIDR